MAVMLSGLTSMIIYHVIPGISVELCNILIYSHNSRLSRPLRGRDPNKISLSFYRPSRT